MTESRTITLATLADENYAIALAVLLQSITRNMSSSSRAEVFVIDGGITAETKLRLETSFDPHHVSVNYVAPIFGEESELPVWGRLPALTYSRIFIAELLPETCSKVIFLDSDVMMLAAVERLWQTELRGKSLLAVQDPAIPFTSQPGGLSRGLELQIPPDHPFFNAGVMLINLDKWRQTQVSRRAMDYVRRFSRELNNCDQDALNAVLWSDWGPLDLRWQVQPRLSKRTSRTQPHLSPEQRAKLAADPWIVHFSGRLKPWLYRSGDDTDRAFFEYLDQTAWKGWRPPRSARAWLYRFYDSPVRDWCYPVERWAHSFVRQLSQRSSRVQ